MTNSDQGDKPVVRAGRRRPSGPTTPGGRERAQAPRREGRTDQTRTTAPVSRPPQMGSQPQQQGSYQAPGQGWGGSRSGGGRGPGMSRGTLLILGILALVVIYFLMQGGGGGDDEGLIPSDQTVQEVPTSAPALVQPTARPLATATTRAATKPAVAPAGSSTGDSWLVMLYQDADDKILEKDIYVDLNEAERVGSSDQVRIVAQVDRYVGGYAEDGDWTDTKRFYVTQDNDLQRVGSDVVAELGEMNMADGNTLVDFVTWAMQTYPADRVALIMSDHGMGWPGGWSDPAPATAKDNSTPLSSALGNQMYLHELDAALQTIRQRTGVDKLELVGLDACLMGQLEVLSALEPHARYAVTSEETEPALGWAYASFLNALQANPAMSGAELGELIVSSYINDDQRIVDDEARADLVGRGGSPMGGLFGFSVPTSEQVVSQMGRNVTLAAVDLSAVPALVDSVDKLCIALQGANQNSVAQARGYAQSFTSVFGQQVPPAYIDLGHWAQLLKQTNAGASVNQAVDSMLGAMQNAVLAEKHGSGKPGATGVAIYFPNSQLYRTPVTGPASYSKIASRFASTSLWDDYLAFHYTGRAFDASSQQAVVPESGTAVSAPGQGVFEMAPVQVSSNVAAPGQPVLISTDITAQNLGYVMLFAGYFDSQSNSLYVADMDYLESPQTRELNGVYYPVWPTGEFRLEFEWEPVVFYISDGANSVPALLNPKSYGATAEDAVYTVDGIYTYASGESRNARLYFRDGMLRQVFGFTGDPSASAPREIHPSTGDRFTVLEQWFDLDAQGRVVNRAVEQGGTLTFRDSMFTWELLDAAAGNYVVGFIAQDLDGNSQQAYAQIQVR